ncbi:unnamed protein product [Rotaria magnacalcarata]|nr:unnamed protein product [Rotaria magnacalcarata]CAF4114849.1 unnamed protein product [Rotaria magnacalcarata]
MDAFQSPPTAHCHAPNPDLVPALQLKSDIKARATVTDEPTSSILHTALRAYPLSAAGQLPKTDALMLTIRRQRVAPSLDPDGRLPEKLRKTDRGEDLILFESVKLIIFTTKSNLSILKQYKHWFADGTFKVIANETFSLLSLIVSRLVGDVIKAFDIVAELFDDDADDPLDYFEKTWIGERKRRGIGRKDPQFAHQLWNVYDRIIAGVPRSNNAVEGWHNAFASRVSINHPTIIKLTEKTRREQSKFEIDIAKILQGHEVKTRKLMYKKLDERIESLVSAYDSYQLGQYLSNVAANIYL